MIVELLNWDFRMPLQDYLAWVIGIAAILWGGGPERAVAISWLLLFELIPGAYGFFTDVRHFAGGIDIFYGSVDVLAAAAWITIALYANRNYTLWIAAMQVLAVSAHLASGIAEELISSTGYSFMVITPGWIQLLLLAIGLTRHVMRKRKHGEYRDWRIVRNPGNFTAPSVAVRQQAPLFGNEQASWRDDVK